MSLQATVNLWPGLRFKELQSHGICLFFTNYIVYMSFIWDGRCSATIPIQSVENVVHCIVIVAHFYVHVLFPLVA